MRLTNKELIHRLEMGLKELEYTMKHTKNIKMSYFPINQIKITIEELKERINNEQN